MPTQNDWLSSYFGDDVAEDLEKTAQAHLLVKLAEHAGLDINQLSEEELMQLVAELQGSLEGQQGGQPGGQQPGMAPGGGPSPLQPGQPGYDMNPTQMGGGMPPNLPGRNGLPGQGMQRPQPQGAPGQGLGAQGGQPPGGGGGLTPEMAKEAQAKFEEADALGRVMAHAYVEELDKIASVRETEKTAGFGSKAKDVAGRAANFAKKNKGAIGATAAGTAVGYAAGRSGKKKTASSAAFEKLANDRALEILQTLGIDPATGQPINGGAGQQPQQGQEPDLGQAVDARALQMLADVGYDPQQVATAYDQAVGPDGQQQ